MIPEGLAAQIAKAALEGSKGETSFDVPGGACRLHWYTINGQVFRLDAEIVKSYKQAVALIGPAEMRAPLAESAGAQLVDELGKKMREMGFDL